MEPIGNGEDYEELIEELMEARESLNKVHSEGYFENHYPKADKGLKEVLHNRTVKAISMLASPAPKNSLGKKAEGEKGVGNIIINITIPGVSNGESD